MRGGRGPPHLSPNVALSCPHKVRRFSAWPATVVRCYSATKSTTGENDAPNPKGANFQSLTIISFLKMKPIFFAIVVDNFLNLRCNRDRHSNRNFKAPYLALSEQVGSGPPCLGPFRYREKIFIMASSGICSEPESFFRVSIGRRIEK